ncbi:hypothetical protein [Streptomyces jeddahensis]|uniref:Uncharacterized protein n=1 Tax=Streptomyces jeddahensis TaxID=1716141 RepID=A0A177HRM9_9ACTN|nr:hypothetical protein [Streptomyces jeddahensis]OAH13672.1 hypothetical protein STSP_30260 [Streptomyces jeddahensis]
MLQHHVLQHSVLRHLRTARCLCDADSSVVAVRAVSRFLRGPDFRALGRGPGSARLADVLSHLPSDARRRAYLLVAAMHGAPVSLVRGLTGEDLAAWTVRQYGNGPYPAVFIGAGSGAAVHLAAALGAPVLPQTCLVPVRARLDPDRPRAAMMAGLHLGRRMVEANPDLALCHIHDPGQNRAMTVRFACFRFKRLRLGATLQGFLERSLAPGATIFVVDCTLAWPMSVLGERHRFQFGALGGMTADEYGAGSERIARFLAEQGASVRQWDAPPPDELYPEAEWGYDDALTADVLELARRCGYQVRRITIAEPEHLSPLVAEFHRWWYRRRGLPDDRLLIETYTQWEPYWALRLGAVPFWLQFTTRPSYRCATDYLAHAEPYQRIHVSLFSNGQRSVGLVPVEHWRGLARRYAGTAGGTIGVDERAYPEDLGSVLRYRPALAALPGWHPLPPPVGMAELDEFLAGIRGTAAYQAASMETLLGS